MGEWIEVPALSGEQQFAAYVARPTGTPKAAVIVIQEIFGVNPGIRHKVDRWAEEGYLAIAPDMFHALEPRVELNPDVPEEMQKAFGLMQRFNGDDAIRDIEATIRFARAEAGNRKVGLVGFCLGGRLAYLTATRTDIDASVGYYGVGIDKLLGESHAISRPLLLHIAAADSHVGPDQQAAVHAGLAGNHHVTLYDYEGADHGFATEIGKRRQEEPARRADERTRAFFAEHLA